MQVSCADLEGGRGRKFRDPPPISPASAAITILLCSTPPLHPLLAEKHRIRIWVFSGIYNPSRMTLYGAHVISLNVITPYITRCLDDLMNDVQGFSYVDVQCFKVVFSDITRLHVIIFFVSGNRLIAISRAFPVELGCPNSCDCVNRLSLSIL